MPRSDTIAIVSDFDDTLGDDTTELFLKEKLAMNETDIRAFWNTDVSGLVKKGWDPPLAYISLILKRVQKQGLKITNADLRDLGKKVKLYPGVLDLCQRLEEFVTTRKELEEAHVRVEFYVISAGFEEIIRGTSITNEFSGVFGCTVDEQGGQLVPKSIVTFTEKTKFLYAIHKGISGRELRRNPYSVNDVIAPDERRIPFTNMIYLGDGPTDIPCFSTIQRNKGKTIGILKYHKKHGQVLVDKRRAWAIAKGERTTLGPFSPNYEENSDLYINLRMQVERVGLDIYDEFQRRRGHRP
jgi:hypothetical protein